MNHRMAFIYRPVAAAIAVTGLLMCVPSVSRGSFLTFYTSPSDFSAAAPGLPVETFSGAVTFGPNYYVTHSSPISSATNDAVIPAGTILPGLSVTTLNPGLVSSALEIQGSGSNPKAVGTNWFQDTLILDFAPAVSAVGENVLGNVYPGPSFAGRVTEQVYSGSTLLGSTNLSEAAGAGGYIGVASPTADITSIDLLFTPSADTDSNTYVSNVSFGAAVVPEPSSVALLAAGGLWILLRRRRGTGSPAD